MQQSENDMNGTSSQEQRQQRFRVTGMHCASCVRRVETALEHVPGVQSASVNLATREAQVAFDAAQTDVPRIGQAVVDIGYGMEPLTTTVDTVETEADSDSAESRDLRNRLIFAATCASPVFFISMADIQFTGRN